ncbi:MAG: lamin tail domain-containing protein, partial [Phycisphaerales bacterium]
TTTCLRAVALKPGWKPTNIDTHSYIFLDDVIRQPARPFGWPTNWGHTGSGDYQMDPDVVDDPLYRDTIKDDLKAVPTLSLVTRQDNWFGSGGRGIYPQGELSERPVSAELIFADDREGFQIDCAVMIVGGTSPQRWKMDKLSMRLKFQAAYGPTKLRYPVFGDDATEEFDTLVVDARMNNSWAYGGGVGVSRPGAGQRDLAQYTRDQFVADLQNAMGGYGPRGRHVHLYLNGLYWGLYWLHERPDEHFAASYFGGDSEDYDVLKHQSGRVVNGSSAEYRDMVNLASAGQYGEIQQHLDVSGLIDYLLANYYVGNTDWAHQNWYASRSRVDAEGLWRYHSWDAEHCMEGLSDNVTGRNNSGGPTGVHYGLLASEEYRLRVADHVHRRFFNSGVLTPEGATALYQIRLDEVDRAVVGESARWGDNHRSRPYTRDVEWVEERDWLLDTYLQQRSQIVLNQLRSRGWYPNVSAPVFQIDGTYQHGGQVEIGSAVSMRAGAGDIWYTLDGSDPRVPGVAPAPGEDTVLVAEDAFKKVLVPTEAVDEAWRGDPDFDDSAWISGSGGVGYEHSTGYEQFFSIDVQDQMYGRNAGCYIRIPFELTPEDLQDAGGLVLKMRYDDGFIAYLNGVEIQRVMFDGTAAWNSEATDNHSDLDAISFETFYVSDAIDQLRLGTNILAIHGLNAGSTSSDFLISAELTASAGATPGTPGGLSPTAAQYSGPIALDISTPVKARALNGATWSALNEAVFAVGPVAASLRISEIMYHPAESDDLAATEYVELTNIGAETINLNLVQFTDGIDFTFPSIELAPGDYVLVVEETSAFEAWYGPGLPIAGQYTGNLRNGGERLELTDAAGQRIHNFRFQDDWYDITDGQGFSLTVKAPASTDPQGWGDKAAWRPSADVDGSPGFDDTGEVPELGVIVINELMANPETGQSDWVELHNTTSRTISIGGWFLSDDRDDLMKYEIAAGTTIAPGGYEVLLQSEQFGNSDDPGCHDPFALSRNGETLRLHSGANGALTGYCDEERFGASAMGVSLGRYRKSTGTYNFVAMNGPTPGAANAEPQVGPIVINEVMYHPAELAEAEYVELLNVSDAPVTLYDADRAAPWRFTDDPDNPEIELLLPTAEPVTLAPGQCLILTKNTLAFEMAYAVPADVQVLEWGGGRLADDGSKIQVSKPSDPDGPDERHWIRVDRLVYDNRSWPAEANGLGLSLHRIDPTGYGNDPANWQEASPSPGRAD